MCLASYPNEGLGFQGGQLPCPKHAGSRPKTLANRGKEICFTVLVLVLLGQAPRQIRRRIGRVFLFEGRGWEVGGGGEGAHHSKYADKLEKWHVRKGKKVPVRAVGNRHEAQQHVYLGRLLPVRGQHSCQALPYPVLAHEPLNLFSAEGRGMVT